MNKKPLSEQQKRFAEGRAKGMTGEEAVEFAGYKSRGKAARVQCAQLLANHSVIKLIEEIRQESRSKAVKTAQEVKEGLTRLMKLAEAAEDFTGYVALANRLAKMEGHDEPDKLKVDGRLTTEEISERVKTVSPLIQARIAAAKKSAEENVARN